ncbi:unnamed protein product [Closterium sp. Naga37s-1]|nr:unnamed protein product [Closterium sp. Naga37s-1]
MFRAMEPRAHTSGGVQLRGFEPPREESALPAEEIRAEPPHPSFSSGDGARVRGMTKMSRRLWGSGRPWSPPRMYSRRLWGSGRPWYPEERGWSTAASRHFTHTVPLHHPSIITSPINIYHSPTQFPHPLLSTTHSFPPPTPFHHPLLSTTHSFPPPTPFPHPLLSPTYSFPPPTNFPNPLVSPTHSFPPPTPFPHPLLSPTHSFPPPTPFPHLHLSPTYSFPFLHPLLSPTHSRCLAVVMKGEDECCVCVLAIRLHGLSISPIAVTKQPRVGAVAVRYNEIEHETSGMECGGAV